MVPLLVLLVFVGFIVADVIIQSAEARRLRAARRLEPEARHRPALPTLGAVTAPAGLFLDAGHTWLGLEPSGLARVGVDDLARRALGRLDAVELPDPGTRVRRGETLFSVRQGDRVAAFAAPVDGVVAAVNDDLRDAAEAVEADPYAGGWICALRPEGIGSSLRKLFIGEEASAWLKREVERFVAAFCGTTQPALGTVLPDGGHLAGGILEKSDDATWNRFVSEFLAPAGKAEKGA